MLMCVIFLRMQKFTSSLKMHHWSLACHFCIPHHLKPPSAWAFDSRQDGSKLSCHFCCIVFATRASRHWLSCLSDLHAVFSCVELSGPPLGRCGLDKIMDCAKKKKVSGTSYSLHSKSVTEVFDRPPHLFCSTTTTQPEVIQNNPQGREERGLLRQVLLPALDGSRRSWEQATCRAPWALELTFPFTSSLLHNLTCGWGVAAVPQKQRKWVQEVKVSFQVPAVLQRLAAWLNLKLQIWSWVVL